MSLLDVLVEFDEALEWPLDDPLLADFEPPADVRVPAGAPRQMD